MTFKQWRLTFQSGEQAAQSAFNQLNNAQALIVSLESRLSEQTAEPVLEPVPLNKLSPRMTEYLNRFNE